MEKIRKVKAKSLYLQVEKLHQSLTKLDSTIAAVSQVLDEGRHLDVLLARERMLTQIHELKALRGLLQAQEDDRFMFTPPDQVGARGAVLAAAGDVLQRPAKQRRVFCRGYRLCT